MKVSFNGYNDNTLTFLCHDALTPGTPVKVSGNGIISVAASGDRFFGVITEASGDIAGVQLSGYFRLPYAGTVAVGFQNLVADTGGKVKAATSGTEVLVVEVDTDTATIGFIRA